MNKNKGFTLIELLVVIAIIGILSSVVLASLNSARNKGANTAIKNNLANIRAQAELLYDDNTPNSYSGLCAQPTIAQMLSSAAKAISSTATVDSTLANAGTTSKVSCHVATDNESWAVSAGLKTTEGTFTMWCVDSRGVSKGTTAFAASAVACP